MSRRNQRKSQNAGSLIRPSAVIKICADCGRYAKACYDLELVHVGDYCGAHAHVRGFCTRCGNKLTEAEKKREGTLCDACRLPRHDPFEDWEDWEE